MEKNECIKVIVRVRPETDQEIATNARNVVKVIDTQLLVFDPKDEEEEFFYQGQRQRGRNLLKRPNKDVNFMFDHVFDSTSTNEDIYQQTTKNIIPDLLNGYNCSVFAYGATGAGKTHTMLGSEFVPGIAFLTVIELYQKIETISDKQCDISISYLEVYNETIKDLINPSRPLSVREDPNRGIQVTGLSFHKPKGAEDLLSMLVAGNKNRTQHPTDSNSESSRSHAVFQVYVKIQEKTASLAPDVKVAKMSLIDLAGSERAAAARGQTARLREGANINKSLLALANCINALASSSSGKSKPAASLHIPYRNSKLTHLLKDSLGGNCRTIMIAAISPSYLNYEDTYNTLKYADRARSIQLTLKKNVVSLDAHLTKYSKIVDDLRKEIEELKQKIHELEKENNSLRSSSSSSYSSARGTMSGDSSGLEDSVDDMTEAESKYQSLRKQMLTCESNLKHIELKLRWRQQCFTRVSQLTSDCDRIQKSASKRDAAFQSIKFQEKKLQNRQNELKRELESVSASLPVKRLKVHQMAADVQDLRIQSSHLMRIALLQDKQLQQDERLLSSSFELILKQQLILQGHGFLTMDLRAHYDSLLRQVDGAKEVMWADQVLEGKPVNLIDPLLRLSLKQSLLGTPGARPPPPLVSVRDLPPPPCQRSLDSTFAVLTPKPLDRTFNMLPSVPHTPSATGDMAPFNDDMGITMGRSTMPLSFAQVLKTPATPKSNVMTLPSKLPPHQRREVIPKIHRPNYSGPTGRPCLKRTPNQEQQQPSKAKRNGFKENRSPFVNGFQRSSRHPYGRNQRRFSTYRGNLPHFY